VGCSRTGPACFRFEMVPLTPDTADYANKPTCPPVCQNNML
jgi:hypothetical protein